MLRHFRMFADYNRWANARVYEACAALPDADYRADKGAFFGSAHRTLNHLLVADRIWMKRLSGTGEAPASLDVILHDDLAGLTAARMEEDERMIDFLEDLSETDLARTITYSNVAGTSHFTQPLTTILAHIFNHQTHHRGQVHGIITSVGGPSLVLDLIYFQRSVGERWLAL